MLRQLLVSVALVLAFAVSATCSGQENTRLRDQVYGRKYGMALTMDVWKPAKPNGAGVLMMLSGGFSSDSAWLDSGFMGPGLFAPFLDRGYTVFLVCHGAQPKFTVDEIVGDIHRAVRYIKANSETYGVDPERLGIMGTSSGGYLSLMMGATGKPGDPAAKDPVDQASSRVAAVGCFCPPSDWVDYGQPDRCVLEFEPVQFVWHVFGVQDKPRDEQLVTLRRLSPLSAITSETSPTLIIHGTADELVPYEQSERYVARLKAAGVPHQLVTRQDAGHGWPTMTQDYAIVADWFDKWLADQPQP